MQLVSSAENSSLDWKAQYKYIEDIGDGRGYTAGIIGFCSGTGDMLELVEHYTDLEPGNVLAKYLPALRKVNGTDSHAGLGPDLRRRLEDRRQGHRLPAGAERRARPRLLQPGGAAGQGGRPARARPVHLLRRHRHARPRRRRRSASAASARPRMKKAKTPAQGGDETTYLNAFLDARKAAMKQRGGARRHQPGRHRAAGLPQRRQPRPQPAAELEGLRRPVHHQQLNPATAPPGPARRGAGRRGVMVPTGRFTGPAGAPQAGGTHGRGHRTHRRQAVAPPARLG